VSDAHGNDGGRGSTRREFTTALVLAAAAPLAAAASPAAADAPAPPKPEGVAGLARTLAEVVRGRYGAHLDAGQQAAVERGIAGNLLAADRLRRVRLDNHDEPAFAFTADVR
jgi:hypothetical protein